MVSANRFYLAWLKVITKNISAVSRCWDNSHDYTNLIIKNDNSLIMQISNELNLSCYNGDYYSIDSVLYHERDRINNNPGTYLRHIVVAFEHENSFSSGLYQEVTHLLITRADLKVLVSYPPNELNKQTNNTIKKELNFLYNIIKDSPHADDIAEKEDFLIIFGKNDISDLDATKWNCDDYWQGLVFKLDGWKIITSDDLSEQPKVLIS